MTPFTRKFAHSGFQAAWAVGFSLCSLLPISAQQAVNSSNAGVTDAQLNAWRSELKNYAPLKGGCFHTSYPSMQWQEVACGAKPQVVSKGKSTDIATSLAGVHDEVQGAVAGQTGNGKDYVAQTAGLTQSAFGSFPTVTGVTSETGVAGPNGGNVGPNQYSLELDTNHAISSTACTPYGIPGCFAWQHFVYTTAYQSTPAQFYIQNYFSLPPSFASQNCPTGWIGSALPNQTLICTNNSSVVNVPNIDATQLANVSLAVAVSGGTDFAFLLDGLDSYATSEPDSTFSLSSWWKQTEFNVLGSGGGSEAIFNAGSSLKVNLAVHDGGSHVPTCVNNDGTSQETNNLKRGACHTAGGVSPSISFKESN